jgi:glycosyltransferase involved in cell wall biosynthesis
MKIGIMMRAANQPDAMGVYIPNLVRSILLQDIKTEYFLFYRETLQLGQFSEYPNVREILINVKNKLFWDHILIPLYARRFRLDVLFNPKFGLPILSTVPSTTVLRSPDHWERPEQYPKIDILYNRVLMPISCRKAPRLMAVSSDAKTRMQKYMYIPDNKVEVTYSAAHECFRVVKDDSWLQAMKNKYNLPSRYILCITRAYHFAYNAKRSVFPGGNSEALVEAYLSISHKIPHKLVVVGRDVKEYLTDLGFKKSDLSQIIFTGFVKQEELPAFFNLADVYINVSWYESFGIPLVEAMSCGCPVIAPDFGACPEVLEGAGYLIDRPEPKEISKALLLVLTDEKLRAKLAQKGLKRSSFFSWENTAKRTLKVLHSIAYNKFE